MNTVVAMNESIAIPNHETAATAWQEIKAADTFVKKTLLEINAAEKFIAVGARLNKLKDTLKRTSQFDKSAPGWVQTFTDGRFGMAASTGTKFTIIGEMFGEMFSSLENIKLPATFEVLYLLASGFKKHPEKLTVAIRDGKVTRMMSIKEAKALVGKKPKKEKQAKPPEVTPMENIELRRKEYVKAAKILTSKECEQEVATVAKALHAPKVKKTPDKVLDELRPLITASLGKMSEGKRLTALNDLANYIIKHFPEFEINVAKSMSSIKFVSGGKFK